MSDLALGMILMNGIVLGLAMPYVQLADTYGLISTDLGFVNDTLESMQQTNYNISNTINNWQLNPIEFIGVTMSAPFTAVRTLLSTTSIANQLFTHAITLEGETGGVPIVYWLQPLIITIIGVIVGFAILSLYMGREV